MAIVKRVHIIYKTHLDIGFTDFSANVIQNYLDHFIPKALELADEVNTKDETKFVWSVGAWIVDYYLRHVDRARRMEMIQAIEKGYISWHGMPFTPHCEIMDEALFKFGLSIGEGLNERFGKRTVAAKMTDVPGHTVGIVKYLSQAGIEYLHIGVNDASALPDTPPTFVWKSPEGHEILVDYCQGYGNAKPLDFGEDVLYFAHSGDNLGPPTRDEIEDIYTTVKEKYPGAEVFGSGLNAYAEKLLLFKKQFPVIEEEIGDTWIHGAASDPFKVGLYKQYLSGMAQLDQSQVSEAEKTGFYREMLMVAEHTWGLDFKKYLSDYVNWDKESFKKARAKNKLSADYAGDYPTVYGFAKHEFEKQVQNFDWEDRSYELFEKSHQEQRDYLEKAVAALSEKNQQYFKKIKKDYQRMQLVEELKSFDFSKLKSSYLTLEQFELKESNKVGNLEIKEDGSIVFKGNQLGKFAYLLYGTEIFEDYKRTYSHDLEGNYDWAMPDFYKCGFETKGATVENRVFFPKCHHIYYRKNQLILHLKYDHDLCETTGCPRDVFVKYTFEGNQIIVDLNIIGKDAHRMPESLWISFFENNDYDTVKLQKLNSIIDPYAVVHRGNRNYHAVESVILDQAVTLKPIHSPIVSLGEKRLYDFNQCYASHKKGIYFNIYNNLWGTNFKMWYDEDIKTGLTINFKD